MRIKLFTLYVLFIGGIAWAGQETGNGGDVVVCEDGNGNFSTELLDIYEARELHGLEMNAEPSNSDAVKSALYQLDKIKIWDHYESYEKRTVNFMNRLEFVEKDLVDIPDSFHVYIPPNCHLEQIAINHQNGVVEVNKRLWEELDGTNKGALILHELFYEELVLSGYQHSIVARLINAYLHGDSKKLWPRGKVEISDLAWRRLEGKERLSEKSLKEHFKKTPFTAFKVGFFSLMKDPKSFDPSFVAYLANLLDGGDYRLNGALLFEMNSLLRSVKPKARALFLQNWSSIKRSVLKNSLETIEVKNINAWVEELCLRQQCTPNFFVLADFLNSFSYNKNELGLILSTYDKFIEKCFPRPTLICHTLDERFFIPLIEKITDFDDLFYEVLASRVFAKAPFSDFRRGYLFEFLRNVSSIEPLREDFLESIFKRELVFCSSCGYGDNWRFLEILWANDYKIAELVTLLQERLVASGYGPDRALDFIIKMNLENKWFFELKPEIEKAFCRGAESFNEDDFLAVFKEGRPISLSLQRCVIDFLKSEQPDHYFEVLSKLVNRLNASQLSKNYLGYSLRFKRKWQGGLDKRHLPLIQNLENFTPFLFSVFAQEIKLNLALEEELVFLLKGLEGRVVSGELRSLLEFVVATTSFGEARSLAKKILLIEAKVTCDEGNIGS